MGSRSMNGKRWKNNLNDYLAVTLPGNSCLHGFTQHKNLSRKRGPMFCLVQSNSSTIFGQSLEGHRASGFETSREYFSFKNMTRTSTTTTPLSPYSHGTVDFCMCGQGFSVPTLRLLLLKQNTVQICFILSGWKALAAADAFLPSFLA